MNALEITVAALAVAALVAWWLMRERETPPVSDEVQEVPVAELMDDLNDALQRDFDSRREVHGKTVAELMDERAARERAAFDGIIRASWPGQT